MPSLKEREINREKLLSFTLFINVLIMVMNTSMFTIAVPEIQSDFQLTASLAAWMVTSYSVCFAVGTLLYGRLTAFFSIPSLLTIGLGLLGIGSVAGMLGDSYPVLVAARVIQAGGTSAISALGIVVVSRYFPIGERNKAIAMIASASALGFGLGPLLGGVISDYLGWRYLFTVSLLGVLTIPIYRRYIPSRVERNGSFDITGFLLFSISIISLLLVVSSGVLWYLLGALCFPLFLFHIKRKQDPFLPLSMLQDRIYQKALFLAFTIFFIHFSILFVTPLLLVHIHGKSIAAVGWIVFLGALASTIVMKFLGEHVERIGLPRIIGLSAVCMLAGTFLFSGFGDRYPLLVTFFFFVSSTGFSCITMGMSNFMTRYLHPEQMTSGYGTIQLIQFSGGAFGVALTGKILEIPFASDALWNAFWQDGSQAYSNAYSLLFIAAIVAFAVFLPFYMQTHQMKLNHKNTDSFSKENHAYMNKNKVSRSQAQD
ncbi:MFS transporter [Bacillus sp. FJAT-44742]|uniref:MFS transporter n=1 Tax=Bacillus sp. FJAT-44742 TaxID=2014005 RepID=UPI000C236AD2|nr:MFS transporter [Bacillus sp. FJAT-44742]